MTKPGTPLQDLDTPALCIDLDVMEQNMNRMAGFLGKHGKHWRPHAKCHKTPEIALRQIAKDAIGITCAKVSEAEVFANAGVHEILLANLVVGDQKLRKVAALQQTINLIVACDHYAQVEALSQISCQMGVVSPVVIEVDIGFQRVGVRPGIDTFELAKGIETLPGVKLVGIMGYEGHLLPLSNSEEKARKITEAIAVLGHCRDLLLHHGLNCEIVSAGGTGSYHISGKCACVTEIQAGGGIFGDPFYTETCQVTELEPALTVLATIVSRPTLERAIIDAGRKTLNPDIQLPQVKDWQDAEFVQFFAEHGQLKLGPQSRDLRIGDKLELIVGYADLTTPLHDHFHVLRNGRLESVWPISARGKLQ